MRRSGSITSMRDNRSLAWLAGTQKEMKKRMEEKQRSKKVAIPMLDLYISNKIYIFRLIVKIA